MAASKAPTAGSERVTGAVLESVPLLPLTSGKFLKGTRPGGPNGHVRQVRRPPGAADLHRPGSAAVPSAGPPRQDRGGGDQANGDPPRTAAGAFAGRGGAGQGDRGESPSRLPLHPPRRIRW